MLNIYLTRQAHLDFSRRFRLWAVYREIQVEFRRKSVYIVSIVSGGWFYKQTSGGELKEARRIL